jgi:peptidyl-prolyl cis-trans isomerase D
MQEKETTDKQQFANISFTSVSYNEISDSTIKVTDEDVADYVSKNKQLFKQEAGRNISYITFSLLPGSEDSAAAQSQLAALKTSFTTDTNAVAFVARNLSSVEFTDEYLPKEKLNTSIADSLIKLSPGTVFGPYVDKQNYVLAKMIGTKQQPDSVQARHILIGTNDPRTGQPIASDEVAKKLADSIYKAITAAGADFNEMAKRYSTDASNKEKGGDLGTFGYGAMVPEFNDFCFNKTTGTKGVVKTQFGYHIVDIVKQINFKPAYKIAFVAKEIIPSDATVNKASLAATKASAEKTKERLEKYTATNGLSLTSVPNLIKENDFSVGALQDARGLVRWAFEASVGDVSEPFSIGEQFIVATLDKVNKEGTQDATTARSGCEATIRNKKKAEIIIKKLGDQPTFEKVASIYKKPIQTAGQDSTLTFTAQIVNGVGVEPKLIGASFNKEYQNKVSPVIEGTTGVFLVKVNSIQSKAAETPDMIAQNAATRKAAIKNQTGGWFEGLKKQANIKDNRSKHF